MQHVLRRAGALAATTALSVAALAGPAHAGDTPPRKLGAQWLSGQLTGGLVHNDQYDFDDYGLSIDTALGLATLGGHRRTVRTVSDAVAAQIGQYITGEAFGDAGSTYAGATAKALVLAQVAGADPTTYGGVDLVSRLESVVGTAAPSRGRIADVTLWTDNANVIGQTFAVRGLAAAGSPQARPALRFLLRQQCASGYFRLNFTSDPSAPDQTCDGGLRLSTSAPDTDVTAMAVLSLISLHSDQRAVKGSIRRATQWLRQRQHDNGSFGGGPSTGSSNSNSTGLAALALAGNGSCRAAVDAARWVARLQVSSVPRSSPLASEKGAIAYDRTAYDAGLRKGIRKATRDQWRRATAQAAPALGLLTLRSCRRG